VVDIQVTGGRSAAQRALADREGQAVHHADEGNDAAGLAALADFLANRADIAPIGADAAAIRGEPDILGPGVHNIIKTVAHLIEEAGNRQTAICTAIGQDRRRRHEPEVRHIVIKALGMVGIIGEGLRDAREHVLIGFTG